MGRPKTQNATCMQKELRNMEEEIVQLSFTTYPMSLQPAGTIDVGPSKVPRRGFGE